MFTERDLIEHLAKRSYTFKKAKLPPVYELGASLQQTQKQQPTQQQGVTTWIDIAKKYCKQVLKVHPYQQHKTEYDQSVCLIESQLRFKDPTQPGVKWTLLKSNEEVNKFTKKWQKKQASERKIENPQDNIFNLLSDMATGNPKDHIIFDEFLEQIIPPDKWNLKILGQYQVRQIEVGGAKNCLKNTFCAPCLRSSNFWITITTENILLSEYSLIDGEIEEAIPFTYSLSVDYEVPQARGYAHSYIVGIRSGKTYVIVSFLNLFDLLKFSFTFNQVKLTTPYFEKIRFDSFSPPRENNWAKFYNDGQQYFSNLHDQIEVAQKKICITGWCITPYLLLKRPQNIETGTSRLDHTLLRAAKRGVKIFILVFQEPSLFVNNDSFNVWNLFQNLHENFKVLRHPGLIIPQLWSHHEKSVIIDQKVAFMGGIDICYGRWDTHDHPIYDKDNLWQGADYNNERQRGITEPRKYFQSNLDRQNQPRMPWHDIAIQVRGAIAIDLQRHFVQYWYFAIRDLSDDPKDHLRNFKNRYNELMKLQKDKRIQQQKLHPESNTTESHISKLFGNKKPTNREMQLVQFTYATLKNSSPQEQDYTFGDRIQSARQAFTDLIQHKTARTSKQILVQGFGTNSKLGNLKLQLCRSSSKWSTGINKVQHSIYNAYLELIQNAKEFIYIENQFFMSHENQISQKIAERIRIAFRNKQSFKVVVVMPLLPGFQGDVTNEKAGVLRVQMQIQYEAISRHKTSIFQLLQDLPIDIKEYISFFGLRNHALFGKEKNIPKTEIIYVHSKLMIVDDRFMIIGSANVNDRSLLGSRDSELAMITEDPLGSVGKGSIFQFRCRIWKEHFDMTEDNCAYLNEYWKKLNTIAKLNTEIYRKVFGCYPDDTAANFADVAKIQKQADLQLYFKIIEDLQGHYVQWPIDFLKNQDLSLSFGQKQFLAPITFFT